MEKCPVSAADLGRLPTGSAKRADELDRRYAEWHEQHATQPLKRKYRAGAKRYKGGIRVKS